MNYAEICRGIQTAQRRAAELILHARSILAESKTGQRDVVTEYDRRVQEQLVADLHELLPGADFFCEENEEQCDPKAASVFIIDPIDGTMNFVRGYHHSAISVAYAENGSVMAAAVYDPFIDEMYTAVRGEGAFLNGRRIRNDSAVLSESIVCYGTAPYVPQLWDRTFELERIAMRNSLDVRRRGSAALDMCAAASGRAGMYFELSVFLWDIAAGMLICEEAGGVVTKIDGSPMPLAPGRTTVLAGSPQCTGEFLRLIKDT